MACNFSIDFSASPDAVLSKARSAVEKQGGSFTGDTNNGIFSVSVFGNSIAGSYTVAGNQLQINITDKPFMVPCNMIESYLKNAIGA